MAANNSIAVAYSGTYASKILLEPIFHSDDIMKHYTVYPNVKVKQNVFLANSLNKIVVENTTCTPDNTSCTGASTGFDIDDKVITCVPVAVRQSQCWQTFAETFIAESYKAGVNMPDITGTELSKVIIDRVRGGIAQDIVRVMWGGQDGHADCTYGWTDGLFALFDTGALTVGTTSTAGVPSQPQVVAGTVSATDAEAMLTDAYNEANAVLRQIPAKDKRMFVDPSTYNGWMGALTSTSPTNYGWVAAQEGLPPLYFRGVEVVPIYEWDTILADTNPNVIVSGGYNKHGVVYSAKSNLMIGSNVNDPDNQVKVFYDDLEEQVFIRAYFRMGYQYGLY